MATPAPALHYALGDVLPITPPARSLAMLEMFAGVMYIALVV